ncbi:MAG: FtsQ-type POTRA domain-containing protein [Eubacteriales bacterium]|nr:FtsQ-type POTRA domain-containing protein [Eubacteriales bacterium]
MPGERTDDSIRKRHTKRQQKRRRQQLIRRYSSLSTLSIIVLCVIIFCTPLLDIRRVDITGNVKIETAELEPIAESFKGKNLILTGKGSVRKALSSFAYVESAATKRGFFPPSLTIIITEREPIVQMVHNSSYATIDIEGKILEVGERRTEYAELYGLKLTSSTEGEIISLDDNSKLKTVLGVLESFKKSGLMTGVTKINMENLDSISFNYENRIDGICGPYVDFTRKLGLFREAVTSNKLTENSRGTIDLTKTGKAVYTP